MTTGWPVTGAEPTPERPTGDAYERRFVADDRPTRSAQADPHGTSRFLESGHSGNYIGRVGADVFGSVERRLTTAKRASIPCDHHLVLVSDSAELKVR